MTQSRYAGGWTGHTRRTAQWVIRRTKCRASCELGPRDVSLFFVFEPLSGLSVSARFRFRSSVVRSDSVKTKGTSRKRFQPARARRGNSIASRPVSLLRLRAAGKPNPKLCHHGDRAPDRAAPVENALDLLLGPPQARAISWHCFFGAADREEQLILASTPKGGPGRGTCTCTAGTATASAAWPSPATPL